MKHNTRICLSILLTIVMVVGFLPGQAYAAPPSPDATLKTITASVSNGTGGWDEPALSPVYNPDTNNYELHLTPDYKTAYFYAGTKEPLQTVKAKANGTDIGVDTAVNGFTTANISLESDTTTVELTVTAPDGTTTNIYTILVKRDAVPLTYNVFGGGNSTWTKGSSSTVIITVKRSEDDANCFSHFTGVEIDGVALAASDYEAKSGSTVVTFKATTLQKLSIGSHTVKVKFDDGGISTSLTIKAASDGTPPTGDENDVGLWIAMMALSMAGFMCVTIAGRKRRAQSRYRR